jgi:hypothetical protein
MDIELLQAVKAQQLALGRLGNSTGLDLTLDQGPVTLPVQPAQCPNDQLSSAAVLYGTMAALQEENSMMRNRYASDVCRLENELQELRNVAACALPQLGCGARPSTLLEPSVRMLSKMECLPSSGTMPDVTLMQSAVLDRHANRVQGTLDMSAPSSRVLQEDSSFCQQVGKQASPQRQHANTAASEPVSNTERCATANQDAAQILELYKELERMSSALQQKTQENSRLKEEIETREEAHARDISALEAMLQPLAAKNRQLEKELEAAQANSRFMNRDVALSEPAHEPDIEQSPDLDVIVSDRILAKIMA